MAKTVDTKEYLDMVCQLLDQGERDVPVPVSGSSMTPFLHPGDRVFLNRIESSPEKGDIVLYTRPGGRYILHRIVAAKPDGSFILMGDAQQKPERLPDGRCIRGRVTGADHKGKLLTPGSLRWRFFATVWLWVIPIRHRIMTFVGKLKQ